MVVILVAVVAFALGTWLRRWSLLALPLMGSIGVVLTIAISGTRVDADNPAVFLLVLTEAFLAAGTVLGRRGSSRADAVI